MLPEIIYQTVEQIINVSSMANKWMMWSEKNLPEDSVYVPSVFQMRDAYSHLVTMMSIGIEEQDLTHEEDAASRFDIQQFLTSDNVRNQLSETLSHSLRAFFDTSEYIITRLAEEMNQKADSFLLLRNILTDLDDTINQLRAEKANSPVRAYAIAEQWDQVLQCLTCAYAFSSYEQTLEEKYRALYDLILSIEQRFDQDIIKEFDPDFFTTKASLPKLKILPLKYQDYIKGIPLGILEDPGNWQNEVKNEFSTSIQKMEALYNQCERLMETMPSTALIRKGVAATKAGSGLLKNFFITLVSLILTGLVEKNLFVNSEAPEATLFQPEFVVHLALVFVGIYILLSLILFLLKKLYFWFARQL